MHEPRMTVLHIIKIKVCYQEQETAVWTPGSGGGTGISEAGSSTI